MTETLFAYNTAANKRYIDFLINYPFEQGLALFNHIIGAHHIWNHRICVETPQWAVWPDIPLDQLQSINDDNHRLSLQIIKEKDISQQVEYSNSQAVVFQSAIGDIMQHVLFHSMYHRGQIASKAVLAGHKPPVTDHIRFTRGDW